MEIFKEKRIIIGVVLLLIVISIANSIGFSYLLLNKNGDNSTDTNLLAELESQQEAENIQDEFYVEVKGEVKKPGVFKVKDGTIINDVIKKAGGLTKNAYTKNINLSKKLSSELVIYIYSKNEFKNKKIDNVKTTKVCSTNTYEIDNCTKDKVSIIETTDSIDNTNNTTNSEKQNSDNVIDDTSSKNIENKENEKININTADLTTLSTLTGIGEKKAQAIIEYRNTNGKFKTIDEIKNISGIGEATFAKFKDSITV